MQLRRGFKQFISLSDRLKIFSEQLKAKAAELRPGPEQEALLRRARIADTASNVNQWANSPGLRSPK
jgi:hypothetical protein